MTEGTPRADAPDRPPNRRLQAPPLPVQLPAAAHPRGDQQRLRLRELVEPALLDQLLVEITGQTRRCLPGSKNRSSYTPGWIYRF